MQAQSPTSLLDVAILLILIWKVNKLIATENVFTNYIINEQIEAEAA